MIAPKPAAPTEYVRRDRPEPPAPPPMRMQRPAGIECMPLAIITFAVLFGFLAGLAAAH